MEEKKQEEKARPVRLVSQALPPPKAVGGLGLSVTGPKRTLVPADLPPYYPNDLKPQTRLILAKAVRRFPVQTQALELCRYVVCELTPHFSAAVQSKALRADRVEDVMNDLLHYILVSNCDNSDERFRLAEEVRRSDEWLKLAREIVKAQSEPHSNEPPRALKTPVPQQPIGFTHSHDYRSVSLGGQAYSLTERQAQVIQILHEAYKNGTPEVGSVSILEKLETRNSRLRDTFKTNQPAWKALIAHGARRGTLRLNL